MALFDPGTTEEGDPDQIRAEARELATVAANIHLVASMLRTVSTKGVWVSGSGCTFAGKVGATPDRLVDIANRLAGAERIIRPYADRLQEYQRVMQHQRARYDKFVSICDERELQLAAMTPEDPDHARVDGEYRKAANGREWAKRRHQRAGEEALEDEMTVARNLAGVMDELNDPGGYDFFEGSSRLATSSLVHNPVVDWLPLARPVGVLAVGDPLGQLGRRAFYDEGSYSAVGKSAGQTALGVVGLRKGKGAMLGNASRTSGRKVELEGVRRRYSTPSSSVAVHSWGQGLKITARRSTATARVRLRHRATDALANKSGIRMIEDMTADWAAIAGSGRVRKGAHVVRYTRKSAQKATATVDSARAAGEKISTVSKTEPKGVAQERDGR